MDRVGYWLATLAAVGVMGCGGAAVYYLVTSDDATTDTTSTDTTSTSPEAQPPQQGWTIVIPDTAAGYERFARSSDQLLPSLSAAGLANPGTASYYESGTAPEPYVTFIGGDLAPALGEGDVAAAVEPRLADMFRVFQAMTFDGTMRPFDAGPMGGEVRCTTLTSSDRQPVACGWVDQWTVGVIVDVHRGRTEAEVAELLVAMRPSFEVMRL